MKETIEKEARKTAVEWLIEAIESQKITIVYSDKVLSVSVPIAIADQAKQIEKEQIIDSFGIGAHYKSTSLIGYHSMAEQYYNETYGK